MRKLLKVACHVSALSAAGLGGWCLNKYSTTTDWHSSTENVEKHVAPNLTIRKLPGLPLFGTVSAATAIVPSEISENAELTVPTGVSRVSEIMKYGFPGLDHVRSFEDYVLSYDRRTRVAHWVFEHMNKERLQSNKNVSRTGCDFKSDPSIHPFFRSENNDYKGSGYDRGHLAAAGNHKVDQRHMEQTFFLSNMAPQVGLGFNRDSWNRLEKYVRNLTNSFKDVYVCTGPLYLPKREPDGKKYVKYEVIGSNHVAVPTHFYKIVVCESYEGRLEMEAFVMPNAPIDDNTPLTNFLVPPESVERAAGLLFFDKISREKINRINRKLIK